MNNDTETRSNTFGYVILGLIVSGLCVAALFYIGWMNNKSHVDSPNGDNVTANYTIETAQPGAPGENDWLNPEHSSLREVIVDHAAGTNTDPVGE